MRIGLLRASIAALPKCRSNSLVVCESRSWNRLQILLPGLVQALAELVEVARPKGGKGGGVITSLLRLFFGITGNPEVISSPVGLVPINALVVIDDANSRMVDKPDVIQRRGGAKPISTLGATLRLVEKHIRRHLVCSVSIQQESLWFLA